MKKKSLLTIWIYSCYHNHLGFDFLLIFTHWLLKFSQNSLLITKVESHFYKLLLFEITREKFSSFSSHFYFDVGKGPFFALLLKNSFFLISKCINLQDPNCWCSLRDCSSIFELTFTNKLMKLKWNQFLRAFLYNFFFFLDV